jgi:DNA-binding MarR family transcriptional regulator
MEAAGLIERGSCPTDRRIVYARLTDEGQKAFDIASPLAVKTVREHFLAHITDTEAKALRNAFTRVLTAADETSSEATRAG